EAHDVGLARLLVAARRLEREDLRLRTRIGKRRADPRRRLEFMNLQALPSESVVDGERRRPDLDVLAEHPSALPRDALGAARGLRRGADPQEAAWFEEVAAPVAVRATHLVDRQHLEISDVAAPLRFRRLISFERRVEERRALSVARLLVDPVFHHHARIELVGAPPAIDLGVEAGNLNELQWHAGFLDRGDVDPAAHVVAQASNQGWAARVEACT